MTSEIRAVGGSNSLTARMRDAIARASATGGSSIEVDAALAALIEEEEKLKQELLQHDSRSRSVVADNDDVIYEELPFTAAAEGGDDAEVYEEEEFEQDVEEDESSWLPSQHFAVSWRVAGEGDGAEEQDNDHPSVDGAKALAGQQPQQRQGGGWNSSHAFVVDQQQQQPRFQDHHDNDNNNDLTHGAQRARRRQSATTTGDDNDTTKQLETLDTTQDITAQAHQLFDEGEKLLGTLKFAEVIEALTRSTHSIVNSSPILSRNGWRGQSTDSARGDVLDVSLRHVGGREETTSTEWR